MEKLDTGNDIGDAWFICFCLAIAKWVVVRKTILRNWLSSSFSSCVLIQYENLNENLNKYTPLCVNGFFDFC